MNITPVPHVDRPALVEAVTVPLATAALTAGEVKGTAAPAAALAETATVELSPLGRAAALLAAFGDPVLQLDAPAEPDMPAPPDQAQPAAPGSAPHLARALAAALSTHPADDAPAHAAASADAAEAAVSMAVPQDAAAPAPAAQSAGALLNALLGAALSGQAALELRRPDRQPLRLELQREPDGHGAFRVSRVRIRHETPDGVLEASVLMGGTAQAGERAPMGVDIAASGALSGAVAQRLDELRDALAARGLAAAVRARPAAAAAAASSPPQLPLSGG